MQKNKYVDGISYSTNKLLISNKEENIPIDFNQKINIKTNKAKNGKIITTIGIFNCSEINLDSIAKVIKTKCGVGGTVKENCILIQGDLINKVKLIMMTLGFSNIR